jgi:tetratricopeptide (TPR) repeat protein
VNADAARERGAALLDLGRPGEALEHLGRAAALEPESCRTFCLVALALIRLRRDEEAVEATGRAAACDPDQEWPQRLRAVAFKRLGRIPEALAAAEEACRLDPLEPLCAIVLTETLLAAEQDDAAEEQARRAVELAPEFVESLAVLGNVLLSRGRYPEAEEWLQRALAIDPEHADSLNNLAVARLRRGESRAASEAFQAAAALDPASEVIRGNLLRTGPAKHARWLRRVTVATVVVALITLAGSGDVAAFAVLLLAAAGCELARRSVLRPLRTATRTLVADHARARRYKPWRWEWGWTARYQPWWMTWLSRLPAPVALVVHVLLLLVFTGTLLVPLALVLLAGLPTTVARCFPRRGAS